MNSRMVNSQAVRRSGAQGVVQELWRYPVKSMLGESCRSLALNARGVEGDRLFAIRDGDGKFGSGKSTRRFRMIQGLFEVRSAYDGDVPEICFPDGQTIRGDHSGIHAALSSVLGQPVTLAREQEISYLDAGPIHLVTTASIAWLNRALPDAHVDARRFRPNVLIDVPGEANVEHEWLGRELSVGGSVRLLLKAATERCGMVGFAQGDLAHDASILNCITHEAHLCFGVYADVLMPGTIECGDRVAFVK